MNKKSLAINFERAKIFADSRVSAFTLYIHIALETGLRVGDILKLKKIDFFKENESCYVKFIAQKTRKKAIRPISIKTYNLVQSCSHTDVFRNDKYSCTYSKTWVNRNLRKHFKIDYERAKNKGYNLSSHSFRKASGLLVYENNGLDVARDFLQHSSYDTTKAYLELEEAELNERLIKTFNF